MLYKRGDVVKVWSLQSFDGGGFLEGEEGVVFQDQSVGGSVFVTVKRRFDGEDKIDPDYEVYSEQLRLVHKASERSHIEFSKSIGLINDFSKLNKSLVSLTKEFKKLKEKIDLGGSNV